MQRLFFAHRTAVSPASRVDAGTLSSPTRSQSTHFRWPATQLDPLPSAASPPSALWNMASQLAVGSVGWASIAFLRYLNNTRVYNVQHIRQALDRRPPGVPLLTYANHNSCLDEPLLWGTLRWSDFVAKKIRWSVGARDICFTNAFTSTFFGVGQTLPVVRGIGVHQPCIKYASELLSVGQWVHIFPEGRVNQTDAMLRFKWGVGKMLLDAKVAPQILPVYQEGFDQVLPETRRPKLPLPLNDISIIFGEPFSLERELEECRGGGLTEEAARKRLTDVLQARMHRLRDELAERKRVGGRDDGARWWKE